MSFIRLQKRKKLARVFGNIVVNSTREFDRDEVLNSVEKRGYGHKKLPVSQVPSRCW